MAGQDRAAWRVVLVGLVAAGLIVAGLAACTGNGEPDPGGAAEPEPTEPAPTAYASPPDGGELAVAETGFSTSPYPDDPEADLLSYGVVVENTSELAALDVFVTIRLLDARGEAIDEISGEPAGQPEPRPVTRVLPGGRIGVGRTVPHYGREVAELAVEVAAGTWSPVDEGSWWFQPITAGDVTTVAGRAGTTLRFPVDASYTEDMVRGELWLGGHFSAIFRDSAGAVVGGADCCHAGTGQAQVAVPPGRSDVELHLADGLPERADDSRTEVYLPDPRENLPG